MAAKKNSQYLIIAAGLFLCFLVYRYKTRPKEGVIPPPPPVSASASSVSSQPEIIDQNDQIRIKGQEQDKRRRHMAAQEKLGMQRMALVRNKSGKYELPVEIAVKPIWCQAGEYESIKTLVREIDKKIFLVTLEHGNSSGLLAKSLRVSLADLAKGFRHTFHLNRVSPSFNENVTLSICTDRSKSGKCSEYKPADYPRLEALQSKKPSVPIKEDFTFLFHNLFIKNGELLAHGSMDYSPSYEKKLSQMLDNEGFATASFGANWRRLSTIRPIPVSLGRGRLTAYLTRNDPKCSLR